MDKKKNKNKENNVFGLTKKEYEIYSFLVGEEFLNYDTFDCTKLITPNSTLVEIGLRYNIIDIIISLENEYKEHKIDFKFLEYIDLKTIDEIIKLTIKKIKGNKYERRIRKLTKAAFCLL